MQNRLVYVLEASLLVVAVMVPILSYPATDSDSDDLRERLYSAERKIAHVQEQLEQLQNHPLPRISGPEEHIPGEEENPWIARQLRRLTGILSISPQQEREIARILSDLPQCRGRSGDSTRQMLMIREQIMGILSAPQRIQYRSYLHGTSHEF